MLVPLSLNKRALKNCAIMAEFEDLRRTEEIKW